MWHILNIVKVYLMILLVLMDLVGNAVSLNMSPDGTLTSSLYLWFVLSYVEVTSSWNSVLTDSMELSPPSEAASCSDSQEFPSISWSLKVHYCVYKSSPVCLLSRIESAPPLHVSQRDFLILSIHLYLFLHTGLFPSKIPTKTLFVFLFSP
jgi:hypothetical protein